MAGIIHGSKNALKDEFVKELTDHIYMGQKLGKRINKAFEKGLITEEDFVEIWTKYTGTIAKYIGSDSDTVSQSIIAALYKIHGDSEETE